MNLEAPSSPGGREQPPKKIEAYQCNLCPAVFGFKFNAKRHFQKLHPEDDYDGSKIANIKFKCYGCQWGFDTYGSLETHFASQHQGQVLNPEKVYLGDTQTTAATFQSVKRMKTPSKRKSRPSDSRPSSASSGNMQASHPPPMQQHHTQPVHRLPNEAAVHSSHMQMMMHPDHTARQNSYQGDLLCDSCDFTCDNPQSLALHQQTHIQPHYNNEMHQQPPPPPPPAQHAQQQQVPYYPPHHPPHPPGNGMPQQQPPQANFMEFKCEEENLQPQHQYPQHQMYHQGYHHQPYPPHPAAGYDQQQQGYHHHYHHGYNEQMPHQYHQPYHHYPQMPPQHHHQPPPPPPAPVQQQVPPPPQTPPQQVPHTPPQILSPPPQHYHQQSPAPQQVPTPPHQQQPPPQHPQYQEVPQQQHFQPPQQQQPMMANDPYQEDHKLNLETEALRNGNNEPHSQIQQYHDYHPPSSQNSPRQTNGNNGNEKGPKQRRTNIGKMFPTHICFVCDSKLAKLDCIKMHFKNKHSETPLDLNKVMISRVVCYICGVRKKEYAILVRHFQVEHKDQDIDPYKIGMDDPTPFNMSPEEEAELVKLPIPEPVKHEAVKRKQSNSLPPPAIHDDNTMDSIDDPLVKTEEQQIPPPEAKKPKKRPNNRAFKNNKCLVCGKSFSRITTARKHFLDQHPNEEFDRSKIEITQLPCYLCETMMTDSRHALRHFETSHPGEEFDMRHVQVTGLEMDTNGANEDDDLLDTTNEAADLNESKKLGFRCFLCNFWCSTIEDFQVHFAPETKAHENVSEVTIICPMCKHKCETTEEMFDHVTNQHSTDADSLSKEEQKPMATPPAAPAATANNCVETC